MMNVQGRPTAIEEGEPVRQATISGDRGLDHEEKLIFEIGDVEVTGVPI